MAGRDRALGAGGWELKYLFGVVENPADGGRPPFRPFWAHSRVEEGQAPARFVEYVAERRQRYPGLRIYHYANYEKAALRRLSLHHVIGEDAVDELLREGVLVDLYDVVRTCLRISEALCWQEGPAGGTPGGSSCVAGAAGLLEGVLDVLAGVLEVGASLVRLALGLEALVVRGVTDALLDLALGFFGGVRNLVSQTHAGLLPFDSPRSGAFPPR